MRNIHFDGVTIKDLDLENVVGDDIIFTNCIFKSCSFHNCDLKNANFSGSLFIDTHFVECDLRYSNFEECDLGDSCGHSPMTPGNSIIRCDLRGANLIQADLNYTFLDNCDLRDSILHHTILWHEIDFDKVKIDYQIHPEYLQMVKEGFLKNEFGINSKDIWKGILHQLPFNILEKYGEEMTTLLFLGPQAYENYPEANEYVVEWLKTL